jgi:IS1 family transposase/lambda repressor-like predicted transcriptional regulator
MVIMNKLRIAKRTQVIASLVEGNSIRATVRMTGVAKNTVAKLLVEIGQACTEYQDRAMRELSCKRVQCDEIWSFRYAKQKNDPIEKQEQFGYGDVWTWVAMDAETKLIPSWMIGSRDGYSAYSFIQDLAGRLKNRIQLATDGHRVYLDAVESAFGSDIDYSMLMMTYGNDPRPEEARYGPAQCIGAQIIPIIGQANPKHISTGYVDRQDLTMQMNMGRFTRLTNTFSKKADHLRWAVALHFMHYNFCRIHQTLRVSAAMEAGIADHVWNIEEIVGLLKTAKVQYAV